MSKLHIKKEYASMHHTCAKFCWCMVVTTFSLSHKTHTNHARAIKLNIIKKKRHKHAKHARPIVNYKNHSARYLRHRANGATHDRRVYAYKFII